MVYTIKEANTILALIGEFDSNMKSKKSFTYDGDNYKFQLIRESDDDNQIMECIGHIVSSSYREKVMNTLSEDKLKTPKQISQETGIITNHISNVLYNLKKHNLIQCVNESNRKGRLYTLTPLGAIVKSRMNEYST